MSKLLRKIQKKHKRTKLIIFDLDGTLTLSKSSMDAEMAELIQKLLKKKLVAVIGGGKYEQFQKQFLAKLKIQGELFKNLFLFPTSGTSFYRYADDIWQEVYAEKLSEAEKKRIFKAFEKTFRELNYAHPEKIYGELIEDRETQITFSAIGQQAPLAKKEKWNKAYQAVRLELAAVLQKLLPDLEVRIGGLTSLDVTHRGIDKAYGIRQIKKHLGIDFDEMLFMGDALFPGGNDYPALNTGVPCFAVKGPEDTKKLIKFLL